MKITSQAHMPANATQALGQEVKELKQGAKASAFRLQVTGTPPRVTSGEIRRLLNTARASKNYQDKFDKYQFKLVGRTLQLKEQGLFSKFKGWLGIGRETREQQRAQAAQLIQSAFSEARLETKLRVPVQDRITHDDAVQIQQDLMIKSDLAPGTAHPYSRTADASSESVTWEKLMTDDHEVVSDSRSDNVVSYQAYNESEKPTQRQQAHQASDSLASSSNSVTDWLKHNPIDADAYRQAYNPHASWENAPLINPMPHDNGLFQGGFGSSRDGSMASDSTETKIFDLLFRKH